MKVIQIENLWKEYRLGVIGHGTLTHDLQSWWARVRGKEDPNSTVLPVSVGQEKQIEGDRFWALRDINLEVKEGEILGIIGKNGAGKSTLLKILSRVTAPTKGSIKVKGRIASLLEVGTGFHPELTGRENIFMNGAILGMSKQEIRHKLDEIIDFSGVEDFIDTPVKRYSSGMYVRLAFAVAAHLEPEILVVDEVLAVGDAEFQKKCLGKMKDISQGGRTGLFVSHNMAAIENLCQRSILLNNGFCVEDGKSESVISKYLHRSSVGNSSGYVDLSSVTDRTGLGKLRFTGIRLLKEPNFPVAILQSGMTFFIELNFHATKEGLRGLIAGVRCQDHLMKDLFQCRSDIIDKYFDSAPSNGTILFYIKNLPLVEGNYFLSIALTTKCGLQDKIVSAMPFHVDKGDFYQTGRFPDKDRGCFLVDYDVEMKKMI
jgi:lipopolysaccharide transport system ATP-binding protein